MATQNATIYGLGPRQAVVRVLALHQPPMYNGHKVVVIMPAYNAAKTLRTTYDEVIGQGVVDLVSVVDDASQDKTLEVARRLAAASRVHSLVHQ